MKSATQEQADRFTAHMLAHFRGWLVTEEAVSAFFGATIGVDPTKLLPARAMTIGPLVWMRSGMSPDEQMEAIVHECDHLEQWWKKPVEVAWLYLAEDQFRAEHETRAYLASLEFRFARTKQIPPLNDLVEPLRHGYMLNDSMITFSRGRLEQMATTVAQGFVTTESAKEGIAWLRSDAPDLLAT